MATENDSEVDCLIDQAARLGAVRGYFQSREEMLGYIARRRSSVFDAGRASGSCCVCGEQLGVEPIRYTWEYRLRQFAFLPAMIEVLVGTLPVSMEGRCLRFDTFHGFCRGCGDGVRRRYWVGTSLRPASLFLAAGGAMLTIAWGVTMVVTGGHPADPAEVGRLGKWGVPMLVVGLVACRVVNGLRIPWPLRMLGGRPFGLHRARRWSIAGACGIRT